MSALVKYRKQLSSYKTPFYFYDTSLLKKTLEALNRAKGDYHVHYAMKANTNDVLLRIINEAGLGADCVSGNEVRKAAEIGFSPAKIVFAGVGKSDDEINYALDAGIFCFNCESIPEIEVLNELAAKKNKVARIALRINPNVDAHTHHYITTGLEENKFGINMHELPQVLDTVDKCAQLRLVGIHFHIGSSINDLTPFKNLCTRVNEIQHWFTQRGRRLEHINVGGGLGINYKNPDDAPICNFEAFFQVFRNFLKTQPGQEVHFELGRAVVGQCGNLISRVLYVKKGTNTNFAILDAGMTELIRPALYQAYHKIENISAAAADDAGLMKYDVVGPICESSDCFGKAVDMPETKRGDIIAIRSAGAYGEVMSSQYNLRDKAAAHFDFESGSL